VKRSEREGIFRRWLEAHRGILVRIAAAFSEPDDRDDLIQDMMIAVWHAIPHFRGDASPATFIYRVAQNTALAWRRGQRRRPPHDSLSPHELAAPEPAERESRERRLYAAIRELPRMDRLIVLLQLDGMSYRDISANLGMTETNVGVRLNRARKKLGGLLGGNDT